MQSIKVTRYEGSRNWAGCLEPEDKSWIMFVDVDNVPHVCLHRAADGGVLPNDAAEREALLRAAQP